MTLSSLQVLSGNVSQADWDRVQYYSRKVKSLVLYDDHVRVHPSTYIRIAQLLQSTSLFPSLRHIAQYSVDITHIFLFLSPLLESLELSSISGFENAIIGPFLATLSSLMLRRISLTGEMSVDILKKNLVHFKQLRYLELSDSVYMSDFTLWEVIGTLPSLTGLTLQATDPASHPAHDVENPDHQSGGPEYFAALEHLCVVGSFIFIQHLLGFIHSPCLTTIEIYLVIDHDLSDHEHEPDFDSRLTPSMTIIASKWSQSLKHLSISPNENSFKAAQRYPISKCLVLLTFLHEVEVIHLFWKMKNVDDNVRRLVMSWPKLWILNFDLDYIYISLSTLRIIAENCPELRNLKTGIRLESSTIPPFDTSSKSLHHNLEVLTGGRAYPSTSTVTQASLECQIQVTQHLDFMFPYLKSIEIRPPILEDVTWSGIHDLIKLCQNARRLK